MRRERLKKRKMWRALGALVAFGLGVFHIDLLVRRITSGSLLEPVVAAQWIGALLLIALFGHFVRNQLSLSGGRKALAFWLLVLVLHALPGAPAALQGESPVAPSVQMATLVPSILVLLACLAAFRSSSLWRLVPVSRRPRPRRSTVRPRRGHARTGYGRAPPA